MPILLGKVRTLLEWDDEFLSKKWGDRLEWVGGYPLDCYKILPHTKEFWFECLSIGAKHPGVMLPNGLTEFFTSLLPFPPKTNPL